MWDTVKLTTMSKSQTKVFMDSEENKCLDSNKKTISMAESVGILKIWTIMRMSTLSTMNSGLKKAVT
jgi:hypothetical protein